MYWIWQDTCWNRYILIAVSTSIGCFFVCGSRSNIDPTKSNNFCTSVLLGGRHLLFLLTLIWYHWIDLKYYSISQLYQFFLFVWGIVICSDIFAKFAKALLLIVYNNSTVRYVQRNDRLKNWIQKISHVIFEWVLFKLIQHTGGIDILAAKLDST